MDEDELVHELVNSLAFEVEAIPADNIIKFTSTNGTPLNVKVRVRNKDEPRLVQRGIVSVPKLGKHIASVDKIRLISSDQTILSFNVYVETELDKQSPPKNRKHGFKFFKLGGCFGTSYDEDEGPYLPGPSGKKSLRSRTSSKSDSDFHTEKMDNAEKLKLNLETSNAVTRDRKKLFGKCKPGGCLDPPFGEDKEPYHPPSAQAHFKPVNKVEESNVGQKISASSVEPGKSSKAPTKSLIKVSNKDAVEPKPLLDIYARPVSLEHSSTSNNSNATIRHPSKMSSSKMLDSVKKNSKTYNDDSQRQSYQYPDTYFIPPKDILQHKEEERRYSRERSNDQIRPATTRREDGHQTSNIPHIFDVPNGIYPENVDAKSPQTTKLSKHKGKDNTEIIKQTLTDLTSNGIDNAPIASEDFRKNNKTPLNVPFVTQQVKITSSYKEITSADITHIKNLDDFDIPITSDDLDLSIISKSDPDESKNPWETNSEEHYQNVISTKNSEAIEISPKEKPIADKLYEPENKYLLKDMRNKNILKSDEPMKPETINIGKPESGKLDNYNISPTLVNDQGAGKILQSVPSSDIQKSPQTGHLPRDLNGTSKDKPTLTSDEIKKAADSQLSSNLAKDQTKLLMAVRLPSLENVVDDDVTNEKNNTKPVAKFKDNDENKKKETYVYADTEKYLDDIHNLPSRETSQGQTNENQELKANNPINDYPNLLVSGVDDEKMKKSLRTGEIPEKHVQNPNILVSEADDDKTNKSLTSGEIPKKQIENPKLLASEADDDNINKSLTTGEIPKKQINGNKNIQEERIQNLQISNKLEVDMVQKPFNNFPVFKDSERKTLQNLDLKIVDSENFDNLGVENYDKTLEDELDDLKSRDTPCNNVKVRDKLQNNTNLITNQIKMQNTTPSETFHKQVLDEQYRRIEGNENTNIVPNSAVEANIAETFIHEPIKSNKHIANIPDMKDVNLNNDNDFNMVQIRKPNNITKVMSENLEEFDKQIQDSKYTKNKLSDNKVTSFENDFNSADKKQPLTTSTVDSGQIKRQTIDTSIKTFKTSSDHILNTGTEFAASSTNSIETSNLNYDDNKKAPLNVNLTDNHNVIIKNTSLHDRNINLTIDTQDKIPSAILHKPPLMRTEDSDLRNDDINVIKPFKRNTFTIVASSTSLDKQEKPISIQQTNHTTDELVKTRKDTNFASNEQTITDSDRLTQNDDQNNNDFIVDSKQETITTDPFLNISKYSETSLKIDDGLRKSYSETENQSKDPVSPGNHNTDHIETMWNTISDDIVRTNHYAKSYLASDVTSNDINIVDNEILKGQAQTDIQMYYKEKLSFKNLPHDLVKNISEHQDKSDDDTEHLQTEPKIHNDEELVNGVLSEKYNDITADNMTIQIAHPQSQDNADDRSRKKISVLNILNKEAKDGSMAGLTNDTDEKTHDETEPKIHNDEKIVNGVLSEKYNDNTADNTTIQIAHPQSRDNADDLSREKISVLNISMKEAEDGSMAGLTKNTEEKTHEETLEVMSNEKSDTKYARNAMDYGSRLLEMSERKYDNELEDPKNTPVDISTLRIEGGEPDENASKLFSAEKSGKVVDRHVELEFQPIYTSDQSANIPDEDDTARKKMDLGAVEKVDKVIDKKSLIPEDYNSYYVDNEIDNENLRRESDSETIASFNEKMIDQNLLKPKDNTRYYTDNVNDTKIDEDGDLKSISKSYSVENFNKHIDKASIVSKDGTKYYSEYDSPTRVGENGDLKKISVHNSEGNLNEDKKPLLAKYDIAHDIKYDSITRAYEDGVLGQQFDTDAMGSSDKVIDEKPLAPLNCIGYSSESAPLSKAPIPLDSLSNINQLGAKIHLDDKQHTEQSDSIGLKQKLGGKERVQNQNENILNKTDIEGTTSSPMHKTKSEVLILNLALQSYVNDNNNTVVQTISPLVEPVRYTDDNITVVQSLIRHGQEIRIPVDVENDLSLKFTTKTHQVPQHYNTDQNSSKKGRLTRNLSEHAHHHPENINKSLAFVYERELIPLHNVIKNLTEEINILTTQQELLKDKMRGAKRTKSLRLIPVNKRCGCGRM